MFEGLLNRFESLHISSNKTETLGTNIPLYERGRLLSEGINSLSELLGAHPIKNNKNQLVYALDKSGNTLDFTFNRDGERTMSIDCILTKKGDNFRTTHIGLVSEVRCNVPDREIICTYRVGPGTQTKNISVPKINI